MSTSHQVDHRVAVAAETARFVSVARGADPAAPIPTTPGWTLADLVKHAGSVQRWFTVLLRQRIQERPRSRDVDLRLPEHPSDYADWLAMSVAEAEDVFAATDLNAPMWAWGADQHARFWVRRMLFETLLHRVDAELALGHRPTIDRALAVDGVDEFLTNLPYAAFFAPKTANLRGTDRTIRFSCSDGGGDWLIRLRPDGFGLDAGPAAGAGSPEGEGPPEAVETGPADATVRATAADLLLLVYGRLDRTAGGVELLGDEELLALWFDNSEF